MIGFRRIIDGSFLFYLFVVRISLLWRQQTKQTEHGGIDDNTDQNIREIINDHNQQIRKARGRTNIQVENDTGEDFDSREQNTDL